jgi:hypothetical protein
VPPARGVGGPGALTHCSCLLLREGGPRGMLGWGLGAPSQADNVARRWVVPGSTGRRANSKSKRPIGLVVEAVPCSDNSLHRILPPDHSLPEPIIHYFKDQCSCRRNEPPQSAQIVDHVIAPLYPVTSTKRVVASLVPGLVGKR